MLEIKNKKEVYKILMMLEYQTLILFICHYHSYHH